MYGNHRPRLLMLEGISPHQASVSTHKRSHFLKRSKLRETDFRADCNAGFRVRKAA